MNTMEILRRMEDRDKKGTDVRGGIKFAAEMLTPLGDIDTAIATKKAYDEGRYLDAAGNAAEIAVGYLPFGPLVKPAIRLAKNKDRFKGVLHPSFIKDSQYRKDEISDYIDIAKGIPPEPKSVGSASRANMDRFMRNMYNPDPIERRPAPLQVKKTEKQLADNAYVEKGFNSRDAHVAAALDKRLPSFKYQSDSTKKQILSELNEGVINNKGLTIKSKKSDNEFIAEVYSPTLKIRVPVMLNRSEEGYKLGTGLTASGGF